MIESDDLVALADLRHAEAVGDGVDRLGRRFGEDDLFDAAGIQEAAHRLARLLIGVGRGVRQEMQAAMHIGIFVGIGMLNRVDHDLRLLRRGAVVEIDQRLAVDFPRQDREVAADGLDVVAVRRFSPVRSWLTHAPANQSSSSASSASTTGSSSSSSIDLGQRTP